MNSPFNTGDKVVAYCRYSGGEEQGLKNTSTDEQEAAIRRFCAENGLDLVKVYADPFVSGRSTKGREHYLEMLTKAGQNVAMVFDPDVQILGPSRLREYADRKLCGLLLGMIMATIAYRLILKAEEKRGPLDSWLSGSRE